MKNTSRKPHIYKVTNLETGQYYIGSQCRGKIIGKNYFTSSKNKAFKEDFKTYGEEKYKIEIIKEFEDPEECVRVENYMISDHMQLKDGLCLNRACCCSNKKIFSRVGLPGWNKGKHLTEETKQKMSEAHKGLHHTEDARKKMSRTKKGIHHTEDARKKMSEAHKGLPSPNRKKISIEGTVFSSTTEASKYYNVSDTTIRCWTKNKKHNAKKI